MQLIYICLATLITIAAAAETKDNYFAFLEMIQQPNGNFRQGEIEVVVDPAEIAKIEEIQKKRLIHKGFSEEEAIQSSKIGIVSEDAYWVWVRDAVYFPKGVPGTYDRLMWKTEGKGAAVLPVLANGRIVLNLNYRHATRSWELELPRGAGKKGETLEQTALRELKEETGLEADSAVFLGEMVPDSGTICSIVPIYLGRVSKQGLSDREYSEAIADVLSFSKEELKKGLLDGYLEVPLNGNKQKVPLRDSFAAFAILQAEMRKLL